MRLVRLSDGCYVNPDDVQELTVGDYSDTITVRMRDGIGHSIAADYGKGIYATLDRLKAELEAEPKRAIPMTDYHGFPSREAYDEAKDRERVRAEARVSPEVWDLASRRTAPHTDMWRSVQEIANHAYLQGLIDGAQAKTKAGDAKP